MDTHEQRRLMRIQIAKDTGWTLDYVDSLSMADIGDYVAVTEAKAKAEKTLNKHH